ncbi:MAG: hypothetical protein H0V56_10120 [Chthoniobacterales bacterium]|nr:hypothetical protein [Chthoniobacterales bacterium]
MVQEQKDQPLSSASPVVNPLWRGAGSVLLAFVASRLIIFGVIALARMVVVPGRFWQGGGLLTVLTDWDAGWYLSIAQSGYSFQPGVQSNLGFFPFYPMLVWAVALVVQNMGLAAVLVSHACLLGAGLLLNALINLDHHDLKLNQRAAMFLMFSPVSFFFSDAYSESTFLLLTLASFVAARRGQWLLASLCGMCLAATRNVGVIIALPLLLEFLRASWNPEVGLRSILRPEGLLLALVPAGLGLIFLYGYFAFGDFFAYFRAAAAWDRTLTTPWQTLGHLRSLEPFYRWLFGGAVVVGISLMLAGVALRLRLSYLSFAAVLLGLYLCASSLEAIPRYLSIVFPFYIVLALITRRAEWSYTLLFAGTVALLALCTVLSATGYWMT